ncbi:hypothetical protein [Ranavirus sp.]
MGNVYTLYYRGDSKDYCVRCNDIYRFSLELFRLKMCYNIYRLRIRLSLYSFRRYGDCTNIYRLSNALSFRLKCVLIFTLAQTVLFQPR